MAITRLPPDVLERMTLGQITACLNTLEKIGR